MLISRCYGTSGWSREVSLRGRELWGGQRVAHSLQLDDKLPLYLLLSRESQNKPLREVFHTRQPFLELDQKSHISVSRFVWVCFVFVTSLLGLSLVQTDPASHPQLWGCLPGVLEGGKKRILHPKPLSGSMFCDPCFHGPASAIAGTSKSCLWKMNFFPSSCFQGEDIVLSWQSWHSSDGWPGRS